MAIVFAFLPFKGTFEFVLSTSATIMARLAMNEDYRVDMAGNYRIDMSQ